MSARRIATYPVLDEPVRRMLGGTRLLAHLRWDAKIDRALRRRAGRAEDRSQDPAPLQGTWPIPVGAGTGQ